jgi:hypothetical protein
MLKNLYEISVSRTMTWNHKINNVKSVLHDPISFIQYELKAGLLLNSEEQIYMRLIRLIVIFVSFRRLE